MNTKLSLIDSTLLQKCQSGNRQSQKKLYESLAPAMFDICLRFFKCASEAEDVLQEGFIKLFNNLHKFRGEGSFEGWARRIFTNTAIQYYRNRKPLSLDIDDCESFIYTCTANPLEKLYEKDILHTANNMSKGYRTVFNLYAVEGYSHKEIAVLLQISESTSKTQYLRAKASIRQVVANRA